MPRRFITIALALLGLALSYTVCSGLITAWRDYSVEARFDITPTLLLEVRAQWWCEGAQSYSLVFAHRNETTWTEIVGILYELDDPIVRFELVRPDGSNLAAVVNADHPSVVFAIVDCESDDLFDPEYHTKSDKRDMLKKFRRATGNDNYDFYED